MLLQEDYSVSLTSFIEKMNLQNHTPEIDTDGQMFFRKNIQPMIKDRNIIITLPKYYNGSIIIKNSNKEIFIGYSRC